MATAAGSVRILVTGTSGGGGVAVDGHHVFWANHGTGTIGRADLDGSQGDQRFITGASEPIGVAVDNTYVYWTNSVFSTEDNDFEATIGRARIDGTDVDQRFIVATHGEGGDISGLAVGPGYLYWAEVTADRIGRAALDGSSVDDNFVKGANRPDGVAVNGSYLFWANSGDDSIGRALLDGSAVTQRCVVPVGVPLGNVPEGVASDAGSVYWTNHPANSIGRAGLDGASVTSALIEAHGVPEGISVPPAAPSSASSATGGCVFSPEPVLLGVKPASLGPDASLGPFADGWGQVAPATLSNGGASQSGTISSISWSSWGGPVAEGQGLNPIPLPQGGYYPTPASIQLRLTNIKRCTARGPLSYATLMTREQDVPGGSFGPWRTDDSDLCRGETI